ncbi:hypothetical protein GDO78_022522 [Eleutherodactylus coqui]|uniref:Uncharacterized protein n=1 Tax=Eleutherodactylus coqui TaxID=57060 RepID=A0A8J6AZN2_ELECQ|nr:hypothetical protein GDO78_022522 [Eleutherodactylus coqui]
MAVNIISVLVHLVSTRIMGGDLGLCWGRYRVRPQLLIGWTPFSAVDLLPCILPDALLSQLQAACFLAALSAFCHVSSPWGSFGHL